jgi:hypothetical protein
VAQRFDRALFTPTSVVLCSEPTADRCHRRLVLEHLNQRWGGGLRIQHL